LAAKLSRRRGALRPALLIAGLLLAVPAGEAIAYPSSVISCPTGEVQAAGEGDAFLYDAYYPDGYQVWGGLNLGLGGGFAYGDTGKAFEGWELGADLIGWGGDPIDARLALSLKGQLLGEDAAWPAVSFGFLGLNPGRADQSLNLLYLSATKTLAWRDLDLGRVSAGAGSAVLQGESAGFGATFPFAGPSTALVMAGYESPSWGPWYLAADHVGGLSDYGGTNIALHFQTSDGTYLAAGYAFGNETLAPYPPGPFASLSTTFTTWGGRR
jgi:hypothetical protein